MWKPDEPNGKYGRWGQVASALTTFAILASVIVFVILDWLVGAPLWVLLAACVPIAVFSIAWGFTVVEDDDDPEPIADVGQSSDESKITLMEPKGRFGRFGQVVVTVWSICVVMGLLNAIFSEVFEVGGVRDWSPWIQLTVFLAVCVFAFLMEMTTLGEDDEDERSDLPDIAPARDSANARYQSQNLDA